MSRRDVLDLLSGDRPGRTVTLLTWVPDGLLGGGGDRAEAAAELEVLAGRLRADGAFVAAAAPWAGEAVLRLHAGDLAALWVVDGLLTRAAAEIGWPGALRESASPEAFGTRLDSGRAAALEDVRAGVRAGADVLVVADDLAGAEWLVAPESAAAVLERTAPILAQWDASARALFHSDGDTRVLLPEVAAAGFSAVHFGAMDEETLEACFEAAWAEGLVPAGGVSATCATGVTRARRLAALASRGPCLLADDGGIASAEDLARVADAHATLRRLASAGW